MRHDIHLHGHAFRLRPVDEADAAFIVDLRGRSGRFLRKGSASATEQLAWLRRYFERAGDFYFVVEPIHDRRREGLVGIYDVDSQRREAEWGRWVLEPYSNAAIETALLVYRCAFEALGLLRMRCRTIAENAQVVSFHDSCGLRRAPERVWIERDGERCAGVEHTLSRVDWPAVMRRLDSLAERFATTQRTRAVTGATRP